MPSDTGRAKNLLKLWILALSMAVLGTLLAAAPIRAQTVEQGISGIAEVIDADIIKIGNQRVILWGIDAPERRQTCRLNGEIWGCYDVAFRQLQLLAGRGEVNCVFYGDPDPFGRRFGVCESGGQDLNAEMVKAGVALAYAEETDAYLPQMGEAIAASIGLWQIGANFEEPWEFRRRETPGGFR
jgi:endonuclease YncB( thermonuclease family)